MEVKMFIGINLAQSLNIACVISFGSPSWFKTQIFTKLDREGGSDLRFVGGITNHCSASVQAACEQIISSSLLVIAWNKHGWTSECVDRGKSTDINLLLDKNGRFCVIIGQIAYQLNSLRRVNWSGCLKCHENPLFSTGLSHLTSEKYSRNGCEKLYKSRSVDGRRREENNQ